MENFSPCILATSASVYYRQNCPEVAIPTNSHCGSFNLRWADKHQSLPVIVGFSGSIFLIGYFKWIPVFASVFLLLPTLIFVICSNLIGNAQLWLQSGEEARETSSKSKSPEKGPLDTAEWAFIYYLRSNKTGREQDAAVAVLSRDS